MTQRDQYGNWRPLTGGVPESPLSVDVDDNLQLAGLLELQQSTLEAMASGRPLREILDKLCHLIESMVPGTMASVMMLNPNTRQLNIEAGPSLPPDAIPYFSNLKPDREMGSCGNAALTGKPVFVTDVASDDRWNGLRHVVERFGIGACWSMPIQSVAGEVLGTFAITALQPQAPTRHQSLQLRTATNLAGIAIRNHHREEQLLQWHTAFDAASEGMTITDAAGRILHVNQAFTRITGYTLEEVKGQNPRVLRSGRHGEEFYRKMWETLNSHGKWQGEIWNRRKSGEIYPEWLSISRIQNPDGDACNYVAVFSDITPLKESERKLFHLAHHDALTGLPNRLLMNARLEHLLNQAKRNPGHIALLFIDLDHFKKINDAFGHALGDELLIAVAGRLRERLRHQDTLARLGGDEFVIILEQMTQSEDAATVADACLESLELPFHLHDKELFISPSIGISLFPEDADTPELLLKYADIAMYRAKEQGRGRYAFYRPEMATHVAARLNLETELRRAVARQEFELFYQPQVAVGGRRILGVEALLRWNHPEQGLVAPGRFLQVLEETQLIRHLGYWILETACKQLVLWRQRHPDLRLSVNLSRRQICDNEFRNRLARLLEQYAIDPANLELEITEHNLIEVSVDTVETLLSLKELGVSLAIDDFGVGHSSIARLRQLPIQCLKIDRSLVQNITGDANDLAICNAVIALGHSLGMRIIAEGVEQEAQARLLEKGGCDALQGYLYGRPMPLGELEPFLTR